MFKLFRDSMFNPKNIILYRNRGALFSIIYLFLLALIMALSSIVKPLSYKGLDYNQKVSIVDSFEKSDAVITDGVLHTSSNILINIEGVSFIFMSEEGKISELKEYPNYLVSGDAVYVIEVGFGYPMMKEIVKIKDLSNEFINIDLKTIDVSSPFFSGIQEVIEKFRVSYTIQEALYGALSAVVLSLGYSLITFVLMMIMFQAGRYMKKSQLFKMLIYASTALIVVYSFLSIISLPYFIELLLTILGFVPLYILQREISNRIRMYQIAQGLSNNPDVIQKYNEMVDRAREENKDNSDNDDKE